MRIGWTLADKDNENVDLPANKNNFDLDESCLKELQKQMNLEKYASLVYKQMVEFISTWLFLVSSRISLAGSLLRSCEGSQEGFREDVPWTGKGGAWAFWKVPQLHQPARLTCVPLQREGVCVPIIQRYAFMFFPRCRASPRGIALSLPWRKQSSWRTMFSTRSFAFTEPRRKYARMCT